ncbi:MYBC1, partial [Symbiodinium sp. KB8]
MADNSEGRKRRRVRGDGAGGGFGGQPASSAPKRRKRFLWTDDLHRMFVAAIFDHGLKACTPKLLFELMGDTPAGMTSDHIKSHLQKFRANSKISREEFLADYARALREAQAKADEAVVRAPPPHATKPT